MVVHWHLTFLQWVQVCFPVHLYGKNVQNFKRLLLWSLPGAGEWKIAEMVAVHWPRWPPCPYMVKTFKNLLLQNKGCLVDCQAHIFFFKTKNCSNDDLFISCNDRIGKMLHNICIGYITQVREMWPVGLLFFHVFFFQTSSSQRIVDAKADLSLCCTHVQKIFPASILCKSTSGHHRPVSYPDLRRMLTG